MRMFNEFEVAYEVARARAIIVGHLGWPFASCVGFLSWFLLGMTHWWDSPWSLIVALPVTIIWNWVIVDPYDKAADAAYKVLDAYERASRNST